MQAGDLFNGGNDLLNVLKIALFRMLPRRTQLEKVREQINRGFLRKYGRIKGLKIDRENKIISAELRLKGEGEAIQIKLTNYRLLQPEGENPVFEPGTIEVSREWLAAVVQMLVQKKFIPEQVEIKNQLHQAVVKSLL